MGLGRSLIFTIDSFNLDLFIYVFIYLFIYQMSCSQRSG